MLLFIIVVLAAVIFEYSNGFHDAANAIATVVSTKVMTPRQAIAMAAFFNLTGALLGGAVAATVGKGLVDTNVVTMATVLCALIAAFAWNIDDVVGRTSFQFQSRAHRRFVRRRARHRARRLVGLEMDHRSLAESCSADVFLAHRRIHSRRVDHVSSFRRAPSLHAARREFDFREAANLQRGLDGAQSRHERRAKNDGHHHARAFYRNEGGQLQ